MSADRDEGKKSPISVKYCDGPEESLARDKMSDKDDEKCGDRNMNVNEKKTAAAICASSILGRDG